ncbi:hypothetical protein PAQ31011_00665 [Pandoraea aquatica]|uniref:Uncharacterized protein n=1 Tax=Pandoraea aquatica TaxID=2508290 RepID=A0A5E4SD21_9BURK|nr:hypothetical protein PAQ31011_00665 [Pandoraea aquatica]
MRWHTLALQTNGFIGIFLDWSANPIPKDETFCRAYRLTLAFVKELRSHGADILRKTLE